MSLLGEPTPRPACLPSLLRGWTKLWLSEGAWKSILSITSEVLLYECSFCMLSPVASSYLPVCTGAAGSLLVSSTSAQESSPFWRCSVLPGKEQSSPSRSFSLTTDRMQCLPLGTLILRHCLKKKKQVNIYSNQIQSINLRTKQTYCVSTTAPSEWIHCRVSKAVCM